MSSLWIWLALWFPGVALSQEPDRLWFSSADEVAVTDLLDAYAESRRVAIEYDHAALSGSVALRAEQGLRDEALWTLVHRLVAERGFACIQAAGEDGLALVPLEQAAATARLETDDLSKASAGYVKTLLRVRSLEPSGLAEILAHV